MFKWISAVLICLFVLGCTAPNPENAAPPSSLEGSDASENSLFVGKWRSFSDTKNTQVLELTEDNTWTFSSSRGRWRVAAIEESDWAKWQVEPYGPTRKIVFEGWNNQVADGPIEETEDRVDFFWIIYIVNLEQVGEPAQVQIKYGHANWD